MSPEGTAGSQDAACRPLAGRALVAAAAVSSLRRFTVMTAQRHPSLPR